MRKLRVICLLLVAGAANSVDADSSRTLKLNNGMQVAMVPVRGQQNVSITLLLNLGDHGAPFQPEVLNRLFWMSDTKTQKKRSWKEVKKSFTFGSHMVNHESFQCFSMVVSKREVSKELKHIASRLKKVSVHRDDFCEEIFRYSYHRSIARLENFGREHQRHMVSGKLISVRTPYMNNSYTLNRWLEDFAKPANAILVLAGAIENDSRTITVLNGLPRGGKLDGAAYSDLRQRQPFDHWFYKPRQTANPGQQQILTMGYCAPLAGERLFPASLVAASRLKRDLKRKVKGTSVIYQPLSRPGVLLIEVSLPQDTSKKDAENVRQDIRKVVFESVNQRPKRADVEVAKKEYALALATSELPSRSPLIAVGFAKARQLQLGIEGRFLAKAMDNVRRVDIHHLAKTMFHQEGAAVHYYPELVSQRELEQQKKNVKKYCKRRSERYRSLALN